MAEGEVNRDYRCGYCYEDISSMLDPKRLPCQHVFCLSCLQEDFRDHQTINCPICQ